jgi:RNA polymerase sigma-70 factor (ECF subfamily)
VRAFEALYRAHAGRINALCLRLTADPSLAEDCTQEAFVNAWKHLGSFTGGSRFGTWLHRIAVNQALAVKRRDGRRNTHLRVVDAAPGEDGTTPLDRAPAVARDEGAQIDLERAIAALPQQARRVFVLVGLNGYTHEEAAALLGIARGTSKAQLHRARRRLADALRAGL